MGSMWKHVKEGFPDHTQRFYLRPCRYILRGHTVVENGCVASRTWEPGTVKDWPQNLISAGKSRTAEFPAQNHFKSLCSCLKIFSYYDTLGICEFQFEFLTSLYVSVYSDGSAVLQKVAQLRLRRLRHTYPTQQPAEERGSGMAGTGWLEKPSWGSAMPHTWKLAKVPSTHNCLIYSMQSGKKI